MLKTESPCFSPANKRRFIVFGVLFAVFTTIAVWLIATWVWVTRQWANLQLNEIFNQLATSLEGTGSNMITGYLYACVLPAIVTLVIVIVLLWLLRRNRYRQLWSVLGSILSIAATLCTVAYCFSKLDVYGYIVNSNIQSDYIEQNYVDASQLELTFPEQKRNLIYIWLESMETAYADEAHGGAFQETPIPELIQIAEENTSFTGDQGGVNGGIPVYGTTWTAGALFAHVSGLPLKIPIADSAMGKQENFFPGVTTIGDILAENGYQQALLIGSDATFGGRRNLFSQHGNYAIWDYPYSKEVGEIPADYSVWWGYEDAKLFAFAKQHLTELAASGQPFNLSMLTVDTHFPDGYVCEQCPDTFGDDQYSNVMACSSHQVAEFIAWIQEQPFYENTTIVITGDHVTMDVDYCDLVPSSYTRRVYSTILNPAAEVADPTAYREYTTFDLYPTTLAALGVSIPGNRLGLGTNLFSDEPTLLERDGLEVLETELRRQSDFLDRLSGIDPQVYEMSDSLNNANAQLEVEFQEDQLIFTLHNLQDVESYFSSIEVFGELIQGNTRTTLSQIQAEPLGNGTYRAVMPLEPFQDMTQFTVNLYAMTDAGRIRVDASYLCDLSQQTLTRQE